MAEQKLITVEKELLECMVNDIENLLDDIEMIVDKDSMKTVSKRLEDIKSGKVKGLSEKDFENYVKKRL